MYPPEMPLPDDEHVGPDVPQLGCEHRADTTEARDDLVEDQDDVVLIAQLPDAPQVAQRRDHGPRGHQDRFGDERGDRAGPLELDHFLDPLGIPLTDLVERVAAEARAVGVGRRQMHEARGERFVGHLPRGQPVAETAKPVAPWKPR